MRKLFIILLLLNFLAAECQNSDSVWIVNNYTKKEINITMSDGIKLFTAVYIPKDTTHAHPILMTRTPYSCAPYGEGNFSSYLWKTYTKEYLKEGFIMV